MATESIAATGQASQASRAVLLNHAILATTLVVCTALLPQFLFSRDMGGVSNYGVNPETVLIYSIGLIAAAGCLAYAAYRLPRSVGTRAVRWVCGSAAVMLLVNLLTTYPYKSGPGWEALHIASNIVFALFQVSAAAWMLRTAHRRWTTTDRVGAVLLATGFLLLVATYVGLLHVLFVAETLTWIGFATVLTSQVTRVSHPAHTNLFA